MKTTRNLDSVDLSMARAIAYRLARKHDDDAESAAMEGLLKAAQTWERTKGAWVTYAVRSIRWAVLDELRKPKPEPMDLEAHADEVRVVGIITTNEGVERLRQALATLDAEDLIDGIDMRRNRDRALVTQLRKALS